MRRGQLHLFVDGGGAHVKRSAEDERKTEYIVDLVGIVRTSGRNDDIAARRLGFVVSDFRIGVGHGEHDRVRCHGAHHVLGDRAFHGKSRENICAHQRFRQRAQVCILREAILVLVHASFAARVHHAFRVAENDVLALYSQPNIVLGTGDAGGPGTVEHHAHVANIFAHNFQSVQQSGAGDDRGSVLIVVENGNLHSLTERLLDLEAVGSLDVFEIDAAERRLEQLAELDDLFGIVAVDFDVEHVNVGKAFEQDSFALHHRLTGKSPDVTQPEHGTSIAEHRDQIAPASVFVGVLRILLNFQTRLGHARRVRQTQIALRATGLGGSNFDLSGTSAIVIIERLLLAD